MEIKSSTLAYRFLFGNDVFNRNSDDHRAIALGHPVVQMSFCGLALLAIAALPFWAWWAMRWIVGILVSAALIVFTGSRLHTWREYEASGDGYHEDRQRTRPAITYARKPVPVFAGWFALIGLVMLGMTLTTFGIIPEPVIAAHSDLKTYRMVAGGATVLVCFGTMVGTIVGLGMFGSQAWTAFTKTNVCDALRRFHGKTCPVVEVQH